VNDDLVIGSIELPGGRGTATTMTPRDGARAQVIVLPGIHGRTPHLDRACQRLADHGFGSVVGDFYCEAARRGEVNSPADIATAVASLDDAAIAEGVAELAGSLAANGPVAVLGCCIGGTLGLLATEQSDAVTATVAYYGVLRHRGPLAVKGPDPLDSLGTTTTPVLAHYGTADAWASTEDVDELEAKLMATGGPHGVYRYPGAGHAFEEPGSRGFRPVAATEAAARSLIFLDHYLGTAG
jgi:carboxymethylenebutenolidase